MNTYTESPITPSQAPQRLAELCAIRDQVNAANAPLESQLDAIHAQIETLRAQAQALADRIDDTRGRERWIALKREIGMLSRLTSGRR